MSFSPLIFKKKIFVKQIQNVTQKRWERTNSIFLPQRLTFDIVYNLKLRFIQVAATILSTVVSMSSLYTGRKIKCQTFSKSLKVMPTLILLPWHYFFQTTLSLKLTIEKKTPTFETPTYKRDI